MPLPVAEIYIKHKHKGILLGAETHSTSPRKSKGTPPIHLRIMLKDGWGKKEKGRPAASCRNVQEFQL